MYLLFSSPTCCLSPVLSFRFKCCCVTLFSSARIKEHSPCGIKYSQDISLSLSSPSFGKPQRDQQINCHPSVQGFKFLSTYTEKLSLTVNKTRNSTSPSFISNCGCFRFHSHSLFIIQCQSLASFYLVAVKLLLQDNLLSRSSESERENDMENWKG